MRYVVVHGVRGSLATLEKVLGAAGVAKRRSRDWWLRAPSPFQWTAPPETTVVFLGELLRAAPAGSAPPPVPETQLDEALRRHGGRTLRFKPWRTRAQARRAQRDWESLQAELRKAEIARERAAPAVVAPQETEESRRLERLRDDARDLEAREVVQAVAHLGSQGRVVVVDDDPALPEALRSLRAGELVEPPLRCSLAPRDVAGYSGHLRQRSRQGGVWDGDMVLAPRAPLGHESVARGPCARLRWDRLPGPGDNRSRAVRLPADGDGPPRLVAVAPAHELPHAVVVEHGWHVRTVQ